MNLGLVLIGVVLIVALVVVCMWRHITAPEQNPETKVNFHIVKGHAMSRYIILPSSMPAKLAQSLTAVADSIYDDLNQHWNVNILGVEYHEMRIRMNHAINSEKEVSEEFKIGERNIKINVTFQKKTKDSPCLV